MSIGGVAGGPSGTSSEGGGCNNGSKGAVSGAGATGSFVAISKASSMVSGSSGGADSNSSIAA